MKEDSRLWQQLKETDRKREKGLCRISSMRQLNEWKKKELRI